MTLFRPIVSTDATRIRHRCAENMEKPSPFTRVHPHSNDFSSRIDQFCVKLESIAPERACFGRLGFFRKIHRLDSRLTHRPTNRMILTSLVLDHN
jgi:hypothetical protein